MATSTVEDYLKCVLQAEERAPGELVGMGQIGAALQVAPGTVTAMVKTLSEAGLVEYEPYSGVRLTSAGRQLATHVQRRHRLVELFLVQVMGMSWSEVHAEAETLEHAVSDRIVERMDEMLGFPSVDPHGDPIPDARGIVEEPELVSLLACDVGREVRVARIEDQSPEFLELVERRGFMPGSRVVVAQRDRAAETVTLALPEGDAVRLGRGAASKILVEPQ